MPLLANLQVLIPWIRLWHPDPLTEYADPPADFYAQFLCDEAATKKLTPDQLRKAQFPINIIAAKYGAFIPATH